MGCGGSRNDEAYQASRKIDQMLAKDYKTQKDEVKMLLLGPGESGKSTLFKQMKILAREGGYTEDELASYKFIIYSNCITQMQVLCEYALANAEKYPMDDDLKQDAEDMVALPVGGDGWSADVADKIGRLWAADVIQKDVYEVRDREYTLNESAPYFFKHVDRYRDPDHTPTRADVLRARARSTGIEEAEFKFDELKFRMLDVGGQRSERRKWIHCFQAVTAVLFCASLSEYDLKLREDPTQNRMQESLLLFDEIVNSPWFRKTPIILFLNKIDLFEEKIERVPLSVCFPNYQGENKYKPATDYIRERFLELPQDSGKTIYTHLTCAIDTRNIEVVFQVVKETLLREVLADIM